MRSVVTWPNVILTAPVPLAVAAVTVMLLRSLQQQDYRPFFLSLALFALSYGGLGIQPCILYIVRRASPSGRRLHPRISLVFICRRRPAGAAYPWL